MRIPRPFLVAASLTVAMLTASAGVASAAPSERTKGEVPVTVDDPLLPAGEYTLSVNASGDGTKSSGGYTLSGQGKFVVGGKTTLYCPDEITTTIVNDINPPKKDGLDLTGYYLVIEIQAGDLDTATIDVVSAAEAPTSC
jgi:hypothetical protein